MPETFEDLLRRARNTLSGKPQRSYVEDAIDFAKYLASDGKEVPQTLTRCQQRCTELLEQRRALADFLEGLLRVPPEQRDSATFDSMLGSAYDASKQMR